MKKEARQLRLAISVAFLCFLIAPNPLEAHDLWLNVDRHSPEVGGKATVNVVFGHNFPYYDILLTRNKLSDLSYIAPDGKKVPIDKTWEDKRGEKGGALTAELTFAGKGTYLVSASMERKGDRTHVPSEKYGKSIIIADRGNDVISQPLGHRIEIIPLKNPSEIKTGGTLPVKLMFEGKPLATYVYATYAGYHSETEPFPVYTTTDDEGLAHVPISQPGTWMVVANHKVDFSASLTFEIK